jgi:monovalent cation:H+ antiporter-2, CPA2 family
VAGLLLAETEYRKAIEATIEPFKGLLLGLFFFTVGMSIDARELARQPLLLLACVVGLIGLKAAVIALLTTVFKLPRATSIETGLLLGPGGEFAFVGIGLAASLAVVTPQVASFSLAVTSLTMVLIPVLAVLARKLSPLLRKIAPRDPALTIKPDSKQKHAIVVGYGRVGKVICTMLERHGVAYTAVDADADTVTAERAEGRMVYYGDASNPAFLSACGLPDASGVIITIHTNALIEDIVAEIRAARPDVLIVSRARDADHARNLYAIGVTDAVPETIEASLQLSEAALVGLGIPTGHAIASIHEQRDEFRRELQEAAKEVGIPATSGIRAKRQGAKVFREI